MFVFVLEFDWGVNWKYLKTNLVYKNHTILRPLVLTLITIFGIFKKTHEDTLIYPLEPLKFSTHFNHFKSSWTIQKPFLP